MPRPRSEGNVYQRKDSPIWWLWFYDSEDVKHWQPTTSTTKAGAKAELEEILSRVRRGETIERERALTVASWSRKWLELRREAGKAEVGNEEGHVLHHIRPVLGRIRLENLSAAQVLDFLRQLPSREAANGTGEPISATTAHKIAGTLSRMCRDAAKRGLIQASPCNWDASDLPERSPPAVGEGFSEADVERLISDPRIPEDRRVLYALELLTGMRTGEAAARRWQDWDRTREPLGALKVETAWSTKRGLEKETKTRTRRVIPVHPRLAALLESWQAAGWAAFVGRPSEPADLIAPASDGSPRSNTSSWRAFQADLDALGMSPQRHYETRSTFLTLCEAGGGDTTMARVLTHPSPRAAADLYRRARLMWPRLCETVKAIQLQPITP